MDVQRAKKNSFDVSLEVKNERVFIFVNDCFLRFIGSKPDDWNTIFIMLFEALL